MNEDVHAELVACLQALQRAADMGIQRIIVETDAAMIVQAVRSADYDRCSAGVLLWELKDLLRGNFLMYRVIGTSRSCNKAADGLAALGASLSQGASPI